jgi:hypothetical protein
MKNSRTMTMMMTTMMTTIGRAGSVRGQAVVAKTTIRLEG